MRETVQYLRENAERLHREAEQAAMVNLRELLHTIASQYDRLAEEEEGSGLTTFV
jgi:hypothetical protein